MSQIAARGLTVNLGGNMVLDDVSFDVAPGCWLTVIGPNGAGKSTLLRAIAGLIAYRGAIEMGGHDATSLGRRERARLVALVSQSPTVPAGLTVADYVLLGRSPHLSTLGWPGRADLAETADAMETLDLAQLGPRVLTSLSGGERQRAFLARALAQRAPIVLLDEPTTALDVGHQQQVLDLVDRLRREQQLTVVTTMHDLTLAGQYADEILLLDSGRSVAAGPAGEVLTEERLATHYGARVRVVREGGQAYVLPYRTGGDPRP